MAEIAIAAQATKTSDAHFEFVGNSDKSLDYIHTHIRIGLVLLVRKLTAKFGFSSETFNQPGHVGNKQTEMIKCHQQRPIATIRLHPRQPGDSDLVAGGVSLCLVG